MEHFKEDKVKKKLTAVPSILRSAHELTRDKIDGIRDKSKNTNDPDNYLSPRKDKKWLLTSDNENNESNPLMKIEFVNKMSLTSLLEQSLIQGGTEGFFGAMILFQYFWNKKMLGKTVKELDPQKVFDNVLGDRSYKMNPTDKDRFCTIFRSLGGVEILQYNKKETLKRIKDKKLNPDESYYDRTILFNYTGLVEKGNKVIKIENVKFMEGLFTENMTTEDYKKISRIFIPVEDILKLSSDKRNKGKSVFLNLVCLDLSHIAQYGKDSKDYDLETCVKYGQWTTPLRKKAVLWNRIIKILDEAKEIEILSYEVIYEINKEQKPRYIEKIKIFREFSVDSKNLSFTFSPESLEIPMPQKYDSDETGIF